FTLLFVNLIFLFLLCELMLRLPIFTLFPYTTLLAPPRDPARDLPPSSRVPPVGGCASRWVPDGCRAVTRRRSDDCRSESFNFQWKSCTLFHCRRVRPQRVRSTGESSAGAGDLPAPADRSVSSAVYPSVSSRSRLLLPSTTPCSIPEETTPSHDSTESQTEVERCRVTP